MKYFRLLIYLAIFFSLTAAGIYWAIYHYDIGINIFQQLTQISMFTIASLVCLFILLYVTDIWRYQVLGSAIDQPIKFVTALETSVANDFFSWITPGAALGAPAAIYVMGRRGVTWDAATIICFAKSMLGSAVLLLLTFLCLVSGMSPAIHPAFTWLLLWGFGIVMLVLLIPVVAATRLQESVRLIHRISQALDRSRLISQGALYRALIKLLGVIEQTIRRLAMFRSKGALWMVMTLFVHLPYIAVFSAMIVVLLLEFGVPVSNRSIGGSIVYLGFTYVAPTPGASGLSEATANGFFGELLQPTDALAVVLLFRGATVYLHLVIGTIYLMLVGGLQEILRRSKS